jgi:hypothetical protein
MLAFMGEPSRNGDRLAVMPKRLGRLVAPAWRTLLGANGARNGSPKTDAEAARDDAQELESWVDVHVFTPAELRSLAEAAGFVDVRVSGEELLASAYGWLLRAMQAGTDPSSVPAAWHQFAFRSYIALQRLDGSVLEPRLPASLFYNLLLSARRPSST